MKANISGLPSKVKFGNGPYLNSINDANTSNLLQVVDTFNALANFSAYSVATSQFISTSARDYSNYSFAVKDPLDIEDKIAFKSSQEDFALYKTDTPTDTFTLSVSQGLLSLSNVSYIKVGYGYPQEPGPIGVLNDTPYTAYVFPALALTQGVSYDPESDPDRNNAYYGTLCNVYGSDSVVASGSKYIRNFNPSVSKTIMLNDGSTVNFTTMAADVAATFSTDLIDELQSIDYDLYSNIENNGNKIYTFNFTKGGVNFVAFLPYFAATQYDTEAEAQEELQGTVDDSNSLAPPTDPYETTTVWNTIQAYAESEILSQLNKLFKDTLKIKYNITFDSSSNELIFTKDATESNLIYLVNIYNSSYNSYLYGNYINESNTVASVSFSSPVKDISLIGNAITETPPLTDNSKRIINSEFFQAGVTAAVNSAIDANTDILHKSKDETATGLKTFQATYLSGLDKISSSFTYKHYKVMNFKNPILDISVNQPDAYATFLDFTDKNNNSIGVTIRSINFPNKGTKLLGLDIFTDSKDYFFDITSAGEVSVQADILNNLSSKATGLTSNTFTATNMANGYVFPKAGQIYIVIPELTFNAKVKINGEAIAFQYANQSQQSLSWNVRAGDVVTYENCSPGINVYINYYSI